MGSVTVQPGDGGTVKMRMWVSHPPNQDVLEMRMVRYLHAGGDSPTRSEYLSPEGQWRGYEAFEILPPTLTLSRRDLMRADGVLRWDELDVVAETLTIRITDLWNQSLAHQSD